MTRSSGNGVRSALPVLAAMPLVGLATGALFPLVALDLARLGMSETLVGAVTSLHYAGALLGAITYGPVIVRLGYRRAFACAVLGLATTSALLAWLEDPAVWLILRMAGGYALGGLYVLADSWITRAGARRAGARLFGAYEALRLAAVAAGPALIVIESTSHALIAVAGCYLLAALPVLLAPAPEATRAESAAIAGLRSVAACHPFPLAMVFCAGACNASFYALGAVYAGGVGMPRESIALFTGAVLLAPVLVSVPIGAIADRTTRSGVARAVAATGGLAALSMALLAPADLSVALPLGVAVGAGTVPLYALAITRMVAAGGSAAAIPVAGMAMIVYELGGIVGPAVAGLGMATVGPPGLYLTIAALALAAALAAGADRRRAVCCPERAATG